MSTLLVKVKGVMADGHWRTLHEIAGWVDGSEASVSARLRDLRKEKYGAYTVERRQRRDEGVNEYRIRLQQELW